MQENKKIETESIIIEDIKNGNYTISLLSQNLDENNEKIINKIYQLIKKGESIPCGSILINFFPREKILSSEDEKENVKEFVEKWGRTVKETTTDEMNIEINLNAGKKIILNDKNNQTDLRLISKKILEQTNPQSFLKENKPKKEYKNNENNF